MSGRAGPRRRAGKQSDPLLGRLSALDACVVSDALDWLVPAGRGDAVLGIAERLRAREARILERLRGGEPVTELMSEASLTHGADRADGAGG